MATDRSQCLNFETNKEMCPCTSTSCANWGICCECMANHASSKQLTACMKTPRPESTLSLSMAHTERCANFKRNAENCVCVSTNCERKGTCCDCVRNHWKTDGSGLTSCMR